MLTPISCPASRTIAHSSGNVSRLCPGMNHEALMLYFSNSFNKRRVPIVPAQRPVPQRISSENMMRVVLLTSANVACAVFASIWSQPTGYGIDIHTVAGTLVSEMFIGRMQSLPDQNLLFTHFVQVILSKINRICLGNALSTSTLYNSVRSNAI